MRRVLVVAVSLIVIFGLAPPALAQAPAPKVTINGLLDFVTTAYQNWSGGGCAGSLGSTGAGTFAGNTCPGSDVTSNKDRGWYSRERGVLTITGEIGRSKAVWAFELDFTNGANGSGASTGNGMGQSGSPGNGFPGTTTGADLDTDVAGTLETKWLYLETPLTGPGSILPFIPVDTLLRAGMQPATGHDYKVGILLSGDIPGVALVTTWAPNLRSTITYVQAREGLDKKLNQTSNGFGVQLIAGNGTASAGAGGSATGAVLTTPAGGADPRVGFARGQESWAIAGSVEMDVFKGLTVKPTYAYSSWEGGSGNANLGSAAVNGFSVNGSRLMTIRNTFGGDVRWTAGPFYIQPTAYGQLGRQDLCTSGNAFTTDAIAASATCLKVGTAKNAVDIKSYIVDITGGFRTGPLNIEARAMYTPGMSALRQVQRGSDVGYYAPINPGFSYMAGWTEIQTSGVDYITASLVGAPGVALRTSPSYDKYGRRFFAIAADYSLTPALTFHALANASWTDQDVDTSSVLTSAGLVQVSIPGHLAGREGRHKLLGYEFNTGLTYRFAPNVALDLMGGYMITGSAMDHARTASDSVLNIISPAKDILKATARVRVTF